ncbi:glycoside hydrolase family 95 protein [Marinilongibacter aquaticus]|uniref:glycoside hydrolase family 95 protein n=1 Tax=Marinilongibacter aquaticus TaxID=2975157 RepID=UPI0021BD4C0C|nr:glycoside hydrolase family 95 protein [Marinilongibacter aquaticus]UBM60587.1 glycoside hydrolase family 95 protein [Marinilongibacter aquaticus]
MNTFRSSQLILLVLAIVFYSCQTKEKYPDDVLWYAQPASKWMEALPLGNGRIGVMAFGDPKTEHIQLNDDSLWPGKSDWGGTPGTKEDIEKIRALIFAGKNDEADALFVQKFSNKSILRSHQTLGDLYIDFGHENVTDYRRELNLSNATFTTTYRVNGQLFSEKVIVSHPDEAIVIELESESGLNGSIAMSRPMDHGKPTARTTALGDNLLQMSGEVTQRGAVFRNEPSPITSGVKFSTQLKVKNADGKVTAGDSTLHFTDVKKATIYLSTNSSYYHEDFQQQTEKDLAAVSAKDWADIWEAHVADHRSLYDRMHLEVTQNSLDSLATDQRLARIKAGDLDPGLESILFQYGRYLLIGSSRLGTNPANLQGLWNNKLEAPWNADYHLNINLQMNYWLADATNLGELNTPLFDYIDRAIENGKTTARENFGCRGSFLAHATDLWAPSWLRSNTAYWGCSMGAGGWIMQHYWNHYLYTQDEEFLKNRAFPAMTQLTQFYSDWLTEDPRDGTLVSIPSTSPENRFINDKGKAVATCAGSAMDQQIIAELFDNYLKACEILQVDSPLFKTVKQQRAQLRPGFVIGSDGRILEWDREYKEFEPGHRHISHLYGFHPGSAVSIEHSPEIFKAVKKTLDFRLENGGAGPGWSRAWLINCSARLFNAAMAYDNIQELLKRSIADNLFDEHPPFQIDGNFGYTAGVTEMLLQSHEKGIIRLLPALPDNWKTGHITGIHARGGLEFDIFWERTLLKEVTIRATKDAAFRLVYRKKDKDIELEAGDEITLTF